MVVDSSHFKYLDDETLELRPLQITGVEREIEIGLPRSLANELPDKILVKPSSLNLPYTKILDFPYEWLWGGPAHKDEGLYLFELAFYFDPDGRFFSGGTAGRAKAVENRYKNFEEGTWRDYVLEKLLVEEYRSTQGYRWIVENKPTVKQFHEQFTLPVSDKRLLIVWFWYNEDWVKDHPEWYERRKALSRRILDSVRLSDPGVDN
jgi:hypothetical protein